VNRVSIKMLQISISKVLLILILLPLSKAQDVTTFSTNVRVVNLFAGVRDGQGRSVPNLTKDDFILEEDGRPQTIRYFSQESGLPLTLGILVDTSVSQRRLLSEERTASFRFLSQVLRPDQDRAFVMHFDREVELLQDLTSSREQLDQALARLQTPKPPPRKRGDPKVGAWALSGTALYDSVLLASEEVLTRQSGRKAVVLLTDGVDNGSKVGLSRAIESAQRSDALVYTILFSDRGAYDGVFASAAGKKAMQRISQETGGGYFEVSDSRPISTIYMQIEEKLRDQYSIGYTPDTSHAGPGYRKLHLVTKQPGLIVETRDGYYAIR
jgi:VWFA-related protein